MSATPRQSGGDLPRSDEWYPRECMFCTWDAALACTDFECRERHLGEDYDASPSVGGATP